MKKQENYQVVCMNETNANEDALFDIISFESSCCVNTHSTNLTLEEVFEFIEEHSENSFEFNASNEVLRSVLWHKINEEYHEATTQLALIPRCANFSYSELEDAAYEVTVKRQILSFFEEDVCIKEEYLRKLANRSTPLDYLFKKWTNTDGGIHIPVYVFLENIDLDNN